MFKIGDKVQSTFRSQWHGVIMDIEFRKNQRGRLKHAIYHVLPVFTVDGRKQINAKIHEIDGAWLRYSTMSEKDWMNEKKTNNT